MDMNDARRILVGAAIDVPFVNKRRLTSSDCETILAAGLMTGLPNLALSVVDLYSPEGSAVSLIARRSRAAARERYAVVKQQITSIQRAMRSGSVRFILLKGIDFAYRLYETPYNRPIGDIDLLVAVADLTKAANILRCMGYADVQDDLVDEEARERVQAYRMRYSHEPVKLAPVAAKNGEAPVELHQTGYFDGIDMQALLEGSSLAPWSSNGVLSVSDVDAFLLAAWHLAHHLRGISPGSSAIGFKPLKYVPDLWRAFNNTIATMEFGIIRERMAETGSTENTWFSMRKLVDLFEYIGRKAPAAHMRFLQQIEAESKTDGFARLLDSQWRYGDYLTSFWDYVFDPSRERENIRDSVRKSLGDEGLICVVRRRRAPTTEGWVRMQEGDYRFGMDRSSSFVFRGRGPSGGLPCVRWKLEWCEQEIDLGIDIATQRSVTVSAAPYVPPTDHIELAFSGPGKVEHVFRVVLFTDGLAVFMTNPSFQRIPCDDWLCNVTEQGVKIRGAIPGHFLPMPLVTGQVCGFRLEYWDYEFVNSLNTALQWPSGVLPYGQLRFRGSD